MKRTCEQCGKGFEAQRSTAKFCGSTCRSKRATGSMPVSALDAGKPESQSEPRLVRTTRAALETAGRLDTPAGAAAMVAAERASATGTSDSAVATLLKQHSASMAEALRGTARATGPQLLRDELEERRQRHGA